MGATKHYTLFAYDINCLDSLHISIPEEQLAPGMELHAPATAPAPFACAHSSPTHSIRRQLTWDAPFNYGGNVSLICFSATDACGRCACAGHADVTTVCVTFRVRLPLAPSPALPLPLSLSRSPSPALPLACPLLSSPLRSAPLLARFHSSPLLSLSSPSFPLMASSEH
eukprot:3668691-Rhodomonas_salina.1